MIADFWLGCLAAASVAMAITLTLVAMLITALAKRLSKFAAVHATKGEDGAVKASVETRP
jgi:hypothetical protein